MAELSGAKLVVPPEEAESRVLEIVADLAFELGGERARRAVAPSASLEREIGLGSLERVELLLRLEAAFGTRLGEELLQVDTPAALARAIGTSTTGEATPAATTHAPAAAPAREAAPRHARTLSEVL